jgi:hypothetical protein
MFKEAPRLASFYSPDADAALGSSEASGQSEQTFEALENTESFVPDPFSDDAQPFGENPFPRGHPAHKAFDEATWQAKSDLNRLRMELITTVADPQKDSVQALLTFRVRAFDSLAGAGQVTVGNRETAAAYERWLADFARFLLADTIRIGQLKDPEADPDQPPLFRPEILQQIRHDLTRELMKVVAFHRHKLSERVLLGLQQLATANSASPPDEDQQPQPAPDSVTAASPASAEDTSRKGSESAKRRGRPPDQGRRDAISCELRKHGDAWREHLEEIFTELDSQKVPLRDFQGMKIDLGEGKSAPAWTWAELDLADGDKRRQIIDALRKYAD